MKEKARDEDRIAVCMGLETENDGILLVDYCPFYNRVSTTFATFLQMITY